MKKLATIFALLLSGASVQAEETFHPFTFEFEEIASDVWVAVRPDPHRHPVMGTTTFIVGKSGVVVFDGGGLAIQADKVIEKIRSLTDAPVTDVIISHWHGDHNFGVYRYGEEFEGVRYITGAFTEEALRSTKMNYLKSYPDYQEKTIPRIKELLDKHHSGEQPLNESDFYEYDRIFRMAGIVGPEYKRAKLPEISSSFDETLVLHRDGRRIELLHPGHGNTEGDIIMWLPDEKIVATGDLVVAPVPYSFNVPPRAWAATLKKVNELGYEILVPGHGDIQRSTDYVDLNIRAATWLADERDRMVAEGMSHEDIKGKLSLEQFREAYLGDIKLYDGYFDGYFAGALIAAAIKEMTGERMVELVPVEAEE